MSADISASEIVTDEGKVCHRCGFFKAWVEFHKQSSHPTGHRASCKECRPLIKRPTIRQIMKTEYAMSDLAKAFIIERTHLRKGSKIESN